MQVIGTLYHGIKVLKTVKKMTLSLLFCCLADENLVTAKKMTSFILLKSMYLINLDSYSFSPYGVGYTIDVGLV